MEKTYLDGVAMNVLHMVKRNDLAVEHLNGIRTRFRALLATPDNRSELVAAFQKVGTDKGHMHTASLPCTLCCMHACMRHERQEDDITSPCFLDFSLAHGRCM